MSAACLECKTQGGPEALVHAKHCAYVASGSVCKGFTDGLNRKHVNARKAIPTLL